MHFAGFKRGHTPPMQLTYLMWRRDKGFRVGTTKVQDEESKFPVSGVALRAMQENADAAWIVSTHDSEPEARLQETQLSLIYGIPTLPFHARPQREEPEQHRRRPGADRPRLLGPPDRARAAASSCATTA